jgi:hypothetical protein
MLECLLSRGEVSHPKPDLSDLVEGFARRLQIEASKLLARASGLLLSLGPRAAKAHDLRAMDPAHPGEARDRLPLAPALGRLRPLSGPAIVAQRAGRRDHVAIDDPGGHGAQLPRDGRRRGLVEQGQALANVSLRDQCPAPVDQSHGLQVAVAKPLANPERVLGPGERPVEVAIPLEGDHPLEAGEVAVLNAVLVLRQQPLGLAQPSTSHRARPLRVVILRQVHRDARGAAGIAGPQIALVGALPGGYACVQPACPPRGLGKQLEVAGRKA